MSLRSTHDETLATSFEVGETIASAELGVTAMGKYGISEPLPKNTYNLDVSDTVRAHNINCWLLSDDVIAVILNAITCSSNTLHEIETSLDHIQHCRHSIISSTSSSSSFSSSTMFPITALELSSFGFYSDDNDDDEDGDGERERHVDEGSPLRIEKDLKNAHRDYHEESHRFYENENNDDQDTLYVGNNVDMSLQEDTTPSDEEKDSEGANDLID